MFYLSYGFNSFRCLVITLKLYKSKLLLTVMLFAYVSLCVFVYVRLCLFVSFVLFILR